MGVWTQKTFSALLMGVIGVSMILAAKAKGIGATLAAITLHLPYQAIMVMVAIQPT